MPYLGPDYELAARLRRIEDQLSRLAANPLGQAFSSSQSDGSVGLVIGQYNGGSGATALQFFQGPNTPRDPNTNQHPLMLYIGQIEAGGVLEDNGVLMYYPSGTQLAALGQDGLVFSDPGGRVVVSNDQTAREGLARPWIPLGQPAPTLYALWPHSSVSGLIAELFFNAQHPKVYWNGSVAGDAGVTGSVQMTITVGSHSVTGATHTFAGTQTNFSETLTLPQPFFDYTATVQINGTITGGTGNLYCNTWQLVGCQS